jgi:hypothetical protein
MTDQITFTLYADGFRQCCTVCGSEIGKCVVSARSKDNGRIIFVCEDCIKDDPAGLDQQITHHVEYLRASVEADIRFLESLRGRLGSLPSAAEWERETARLDAHWQAEIDRQDSEMARHADPTTTQGD